MERLERDHALRELDAALHDASAGKAGMVRVGGEAGIGRTALIDRFTEYGIAIKKYRRSPRVRLLRRAYNPPRTARLTSMSR